MSNREHVFFEHCKTSTVKQALQNHRYQVMTIWIMTADSKRVKILEMVDANEAPREVSIMNLEKGGRDSLATNGNFLSGYQESAQSDTTLFNADSSVADFFQAISIQLEQSQRMCLFDYLVVVAPAEMLNDLIDSLTPNVREVLLLELETDFVDAGAAVIRASLPI